jgi:signal transduction histidine kinase
MVTRAEDSADVRGEPRMRSTVRVLIVEDRPDDAEVLIAELRRAGYQPEWERVDTLAGLSAALHREPDVVVCDYSLPGMSALDALRLLAEAEVDVPLIVVSGVMDEQTCVESLRLGAADYLLKDRLARLGPAVEYALSMHRVTREARQAKAEWQETADILRSLVAHAPAAICVRDAAGRTLLSNHEYRRLAAAADREGLLEGGSDPALTEASEVQGEETFVVDGEERTYLTVRYPVVDDTAQVFGVGVIHLDMTRQKRVEEELRAARLQLQERADRLDHANAELRELDRLKTDFVASVSHELRTPLTSICGYAEMLGDASVATLGEIEQRMVEVINRNGHRLLSLIEDLLILSRIEADGYTCGDDPVDVAELIQIVQSVLKPAVDTAGVELSVEISNELPTIRGDRDQLERVLLNLLSNGIKFSLRGGTVVLRASMEGDEMLLAVEDTGIGISPDDLPKLFTRFYRSSEAQHRAIPGTGLGLAVVHGVVERHGGRIEVDSMLGAGTTVTVRLPSRPSGQQAGEAVLV